MSRHFVRTGLLTLLLYPAGIAIPIGTCSQLLAQGALDDPADAAAEPADPDPAENAAAPAGDPNTAGLGDQPAAALPPEKDPAVLAVRRSNPQTPEKLGWAIQLMMKLGRPDEATRYIDLLLRARPDDAALANLHRQFGAPLFLRLGSDSQLARGRELAESVFAAAKRVAHQPERIQGLIGRLGDESVDVRRGAIADLRGVGTAAVAPLVSVLADPAKKAQHAAVRAGLAGLGDAAVAPLIGVLGSPDDMLRAQVASVLGRIGSREALPYLLGPAFAPQSSPTLRRASEIAVRRIVGQLPTASEAEQFVMRQTRSYLDGEQPRRADHRGLVEIWHWDAVQSASVLREDSPELASTATASQLARSLHAIDPNNVEYRRLYLISGLEFEQRIAGLDQPLPTGPGTAHDAAKAVVGGASSFEDALQYALSMKRVVAAAALAELLGEFGDDRVLHSADGRTRPLVAALRHPDRRLRVAAVDAILKIDPKQSFPGASYVPETLGYLAANTGLRRVLVGDPNAERGQTVVGMLSAIGFSAETAAHGGELFRQAAQQSDLELLLVSDSIQNPSLDEFLQTLRRDPRTADLPVGILSRVDWLEEATRIAELDPLCEAFPFEAGSSFVPGYTLSMDVPGIDAPTYEEMIRVIRQADRNRDLLLRITARGRMYLDLQQYARRFPLVQAERASGRGLPGEERAYTISLQGGGATTSSLTSLVEFLQEQPETKRIPKQILAYGSSLVEAEQLAAKVNPKFGAIQVIAGTTRDNRIAQYISVLVARSSTRVPHAERLEQASRALDWLVRLSAEPATYAFYDVGRQEEAIERGLYTPELTAQAARVLGQIGTPRAQRALVALTNQETRPLSERQAAAAALATAVQRRGLMLTKPEILSQYDRYNASALADEGTQKVLAFLLDAIEGSIESSP